MIQTKFVEQQRKPGTLQARAGGKVEQVNVEPGQHRWHDDARSTKPILKAGVTPAAILKIVVYEGLRRNRGGGGMLHSRNQ